MKKKINKNKPRDGQQKLIGLLMVQSSLSHIQSYANAPIASHVASAPP